MAFKDQYGPWAIVAGASEGTGRCFAYKLAERGLSCILIALDGPLDEIAEDIRVRYGVECVTARIDLSKEDACERIADAAGDREIGLYIANAGGDTNASRYLDTDIRNWVALTRVNVLTTMQACHHFGGRMRERRRGGLLIINSTACFGGGSFLATYNACKGFLLNFAEGLWAELRPFGVDVLSITLNVTNTPQLHRILAKTGMPAPEKMASPDDVAEAALERLPHGPVHNFGLADDEAGVAQPSALERRERVLRMDSFTVRLYGN